ncbi:macrolide family glycosyltransferase [Streptomyces sp. NPDC004126]|uniref:macrolide family glycosyltransferase n=1 Tax=Streptomyces sp. NPDC004126 TaxID=3390695 RepID=UPI003D010970
MFSVAAHGHVNPSLEVIRELVARGHRVTYAVPESFADVVAATGAEPRTFTTTLPAPDARQAWEGGLVDHLRLFMTDAGRALPQLRRLYEDDRPDLVLYDPMAYAAPVLAGRWGVPAVQLSPHAVAWEGYEEDLAAGRVGPAHTWLANDGVSIGPGRVARRPERCIALVSELLQPHADRVDRSVYAFTGPSRGGGGRPEGWTRPEHAEKVALVSLGTLFTRAGDFYRVCAEAFADMPGWHVVLQIGAGTDPAVLGELPPHVEVRSWVPQAAVLARADVFVTHAGAGSAHEGLLHEVPMVAVPRAVDQFGNAEMLESLGVARRLSADGLTPEVLRETVLGLLADPALPGRFAGIRRRLASEGGAPRAADLVEAALGDARTAAG